MCVCNVWRVPAGQALGWPDVVDACTGSAAVKRGHQQGPAVGHHA